MKNRLHNSSARQKRRGITCLFEVIPTSLWWSSFTDFRPRGLGGLGGLEMDVRTGGETSKKTSWRLKEAGDDKVLKGRRGGADPKSWPSINLGIKLQFARMLCRLWALEYLHGDSVSSVADTDTLQGPGGEQREAPFLEKSRSRIDCHCRKIPPILLLVLSSCHWRETFANFSGLAGA